MISILAITITFATIIFVHELGHFLVARWLGVRVEVFSLGFGPRLLSLTRGQTEYRLALIPLGGFVKMSGESVDVAGPVRPWEFRAKTVGQRIGIAIAGPIMNYLFAFLLFTVIFMSGGSGLTVPMEAKIGKVLADYPAAQAGLQAGDRILKIDSAPVKNWNEVVKQISSRTAPITFELLRGQQAMRVTVTPDIEDAINAGGETVRVGRVGIMPVHRYLPHIAMVKACQEIWNLNVMTVQGIAQVITGRREVKETFGGPVRIFMWTSAAASLGLLYLMQFIGVISVALGFFNLLPIPVLDGGHIAFMVAEKIKGSPVSFRVQEGLTWAGLSFLLLLVVVVTYHDLVSSGLMARAAGLLDQLKGWAAS